jgi:hypothetical protein
MLRREWPIEQIHEWDFRMIHDSCRGTELYQSAMAASRRIASTRTEPERRDHRQPISWSIFSETPSCFARSKCRDTDSREARSPVRTTCGTQQEARALETPAHWQQPTALRV